MKAWAFALRIAVGLAAAWLLGWGFVEVGEEISDTWIHAVDSRVLGIVSLHREPVDTAFMIMLTYLGSGIFCSLAGAVAAARLWAKRRRLSSSMVVVTLLGSSLLSLFLKHAYNRPRPNLSPLVPEVFASFPSGHTMTATAFYGFLTYLCTRNLSWHWKIPAWIAYAVLVIGIGYSRVYLGVHWPTDVIGGLLAGAAWLSACISAYEVLTHVRARRMRRREDSDRTHV